MKKYFSILCFLIALPSAAQNEANIWYFGNHAGLDFNSGSPVALTDGQLDTQEGCAAISDYTGQLMFYTDGVTVYDKIHMPMLNGTALMGHSSSAQSATIVPKPGSTTLFYIFTTDYENHPNGFRYSVVDMSLNGGLGAITSEKNVLVFAPCLENIGITKKANNIDYWIVGHGSDNNKFYSYSLTSSGVNNTPIVSSVGAVIPTSGFTEAGQIKISPSGTKLAFTSVSDIAQLFDFNINTGVVSNPITLSTETGELYGIEFSPNENVLYLTNSFYKIYQYNLAAANIPNSKVTLYSGTLIPAALQLGPDGKIYCAIYGERKVSVINNPDIVGLGCNLQISAIDLAGRICNGGLPSFNRSYFNPTFRVENVCEGSSTQFTLTSTINVLSTVWDFGDGSTQSNDLNPTHQYTAAGNYPVSVVITSTTGVIAKSKTISISATPIVAQQPSNLYACDTDNDSKEPFDLSQQTSSILGLQSPANFTVSYHISLVDANSRNNDLGTNFTNTSNPQTIYARIENKLNPNCFATTSFQLQVKAPPVLDLDDVYSNCEGNVVTIDAPSGLSGYNWSNGATTSSTSIATAGNYSLTVTKNYGTIACTTTKSFTVNNSGKAIISSIETQDWTDNQNAIIVQLSSDSIGDYEYSLDGVHYQDSNIFEGLSSGQYTVHVNDKLGCGEVSQDVFLLIYPKFFSPNGDGINDSWHIKFSNIEEPEMELKIFDRYGKLILVFNGLDFGWDGTLNGKTLFADDYWFVVKRQNGKEFMGHFSLLR